MLDKMNEFADNTFKMGESIFRSISTSDFFTKRGYSTQQVEDNKDDES